MEPRYTTLHSAITRPRIAVGAASWSSEFVVAVKEMAAAPISTSAASARPSVGAAAMAARRAPKASAIAPSPVSDGLPRAGRGHRAEDRTGAHGSGERTVGRGPAVECVASHQREHDLEVEGQGADDGHGQQRHAKGGIGPHLAQSLAQLPGLAAGERPALQRGGIHRQQGAHGHEEGRTADRKAWRDAGDSR